MVEVAGSVVEVAGSVVEVADGQVEPDPLRFPPRVEPVPATTTGTESDADPWPPAFVPWCNAPVGPMPREVVVGRTTAGAAGREALNGATGADRWWPEDTVHEAVTAPPPVAPEPPSGTTQTPRAPPT